MNGQKQNCVLRLNLIVIQSSLVAVFPAPLGCPLSTKVTLPFHIHAKTNFSKKKA